MLFGMDEKERDRRGNFPLRKNKRKNSLGDPAEWHDGKIGFPISEEQLASAAVLRRAVYRRLGIK